MPDMFSGQAPELSWFEDFYITKKAKSDDPQAETELVECPSCGHENKPDSKFCEDCGAGLKKEASRKEKSWPREMTCKSCGHTNPISAKVCHDCGKNFHKGGGGGKGGGKGWSKSTG